MEKKTVTLDCPELRAGLNAVNAYIAQELGYTYRPKRERSPQEKAKRMLHRKFRQTQLKWMNRDGIYTIEIIPTNGVSVGGVGLFTIKATNKATGETEEHVDLHPHQAHSKLGEYRHKALDAARLHSNPTN